MQIEFKITKGFKNLESNLNTLSLEIDRSKFKFIDFEDRGMIEFLIEDLNNIGYKEVEKRYVDILSMDSFYFLADLEIDEYHSRLEVNIEKIYTRLILTDSDYDAGLWFSSQTEEEKALWKTFRVFDTRPEIGDGKMAVFSLQEGVSPPNEPSIYFIDRADAYKTSLTFVQYFEAVLDLLGIANWQYLYTNISWNDPMKKDIYPKLKASLKALEKVFPEKDYNKYFELLEARWG